MAFESNKDKRNLADGILKTIGGFGSLADLAYPGVGTGIRMGATGIDQIVAASLPDDAGEPRPPTRADLEGKLIQADSGDPRVFHIVRGKKQWIADPALMTSRYGSSLMAGRWTGVYYVSSDVVNSFADGPKEDGSSSPETEQKTPTPSGTQTSPDVAAAIEALLARSNSGIVPPKDMTAASSKKKSRARLFDAPTFGKSKTAQAKDADESDSSEDSDRTSQDDFTSDSASNLDHDTASVSDSDFSSDETGGDGVGSDETSGDSSESA